MAEATFRYGPSPDEHHFTAATTYSSGEIIKLDDDRAAVVAGLQAKASGDAVTAYTSGVFNVPAASAVTFSKGDAVYWDASEDTAIAQGSAATGDFYLGLADAAKTDGQTTVAVDLNKAGGTVVG